MSDSFEKIERRCAWLMLPISVPHEVCHYLAARLFGLTASFDSHTTRFRADNHRWHTLAVLLAPMLVGLLGFAVAASLLIALDTRAWVWVIAVYALAVWSLACLGDLYSAWILTTQGHPADFSATRRDGYLLLTGFLRHIKNDRE